LPGTHELEMANSDRDPRRFDPSLAVPATSTTTRRDLGPSPPTLTPLSSPPLSRQARLRNSRIPHPHAHPHALSVLNSLGKGAGLKRKSPFSEFFDFTSSGGGRGGGNGSNVEVSVGAGGDVRVTGSGGKEAKRMRPGWDAPA
jgi:hypothetical protein